MYRCNESFCKPQDLLRLAGLAPEVPTVQVATASTEVAGKGQPAQVRNEGVASTLIHLAPNVDQPASDTCQSNDVDGGFNGAVEAEEQWHPDQVQAELDRVEGGAVPCEVDGVRVGAGRADCPSAVGGVAHEAVENGPGRTEDPRWGTSGAVVVFWLEASLASLWHIGFVYYSNVSLCA